MPFIFNSNVTQSAVHANMASSAYETTYVGGNATLVGSAANSIIRGTGNDQSAIVDGALFASGAVAISLSGQRGSIQIGEGASVRSSPASEQVAVSFTTRDGNMHNAGEISGARGVWIGRPDTELTNTGTITGIGAGRDYVAAGVQVGYNFGAVDVGFMRITNHGLIAGDDYAIHDPQVFVLGNVTYDYGITALVIENHGTLQGGVLTTGGNDVLINTGLVTGLVDLGSDNDLYEGDGGQATGSVLGAAGFDTLLGGAGHDSFDGGDDGDILNGRGGDDSLAGGAGTDTIRGGDGADYIDGGNSRDLLRGGAGNDTLAGGEDFGWDTMWGGDGDDVLRGADGKDQGHGGTGNDTIYGGRGDDAAWGDEGDDALYMGDGADRAYGLAGNDTIRAGGFGADDLRGGDGDDVDDASGGGGWDTLRGGRGNDTLTGGDGNDRFVFYREAGHDVITDFTDGQDRLDLSALALSGYADLTGAGAISGDATRCVITLDGLGAAGTITLDGFDMANLNWADFLF
jgi:Ca2+-binding RTX toxin-like protein